MTDQQPPKPVLALIGLIMVVAAAILLLRSAFADVFAGAPVAWVHPQWARAGLGFAALAGLLLAGGIAERFRPVPRRPYAVALFLVPVVILLAAPAVTRGIARAKGFAPCPKLDKFHAGNVSRNDTTLTAFAKPGACAAE